MTNWSLAVEVYLMHYPSKSLKPYLCGGGLFSSLPPTSVIYPGCCCITMFIDSNVKKKEKTVPASDY